MHCLQGEESDEEEQCALSDRWQFQQNIRRWSRKDLEASTSAGSEDETTLDKTGLRSCSSRDSVLTDEEHSNVGEGSPVLCSPIVHRSASQGDSTPSSPPGSPQVFPRSGIRMGVPSSYNNMPSSAPTSPVASPRGGATSRLVPSNGDSAPLTQDSDETDQKEHSFEFPWSPRLRRAASERFKGAKNFLKRMESFKSKKSIKRTKMPPSKLEIGQPVVTDAVGMRQTMDRLGCVDISPTADWSPKLDSTRKQSETSSSFPDNLCVSSYDTASSSQSAQHLHRDSTTESYHSAGTHCSDSEESWRSGTHLSPPLGHKKNRSSSDIVDGIYPLDSEHKPGSFPKYLPGGFVDMGHGNQVNIRTGSVSQSFRQATLSTAPRGVTQEVKYRNLGNRRQQLQSEPENRLSIYDNVPATGDPQKELDLILDDLFQNIQNMQGMGRSPPRQMAYQVPSNSPRDSISTQSSSVSQTVWTHSSQITDANSVHTSESSTHSIHKMAAPSPRNNHATDPTGESLF